MSRQLHKLTTIKGCSLWALDKEGQPTGDTPNADNITITLPELTFGTTDMNIMGTVSVPDFTRIDNFTVSASIAVDNPDSAPLKRLGVQQWRIQYVVGVLDPASGEEIFQPYTVYAKGYVSSIPLSSIEQGGDGMADISMNCISIKKQHGTEVEFEIDRNTGKIQINGEDVTLGINSLY